MFSRSTAPAVERLSEYKQENQTHSINNTTLKIMPLQKEEYKEPKPDSKFSS